MNSPAHDIASLARKAAVKGTKLHLELDHARFLAQHPRIQALLGELIAEETARLCLANAPMTDDSPDLPLFPVDLAPPPRSAIASAPPPRRATESAPGAKNCGSSGAPNGSATPWPGTTGPLVAAASSAQALDQATALIRRAQHTKRLRHISPPASAPSRPLRPR